MMLGCASADVVRMCPPAFTRLVEPPRAGAERERPRRGTDAVYNLQLPICIDRSTSLNLSITNSSSLHARPRFTPRPDPAGAIQIPHMHYSASQPALPDSALPRSCCPTNSGYCSTLSESHSLESGPRSSGPSAFSQKGKRRRWMCGLVARRGAGRTSNREDHWYRPALPSAFGRPQNHMP